MEFILAHKLNNVFFVHKSQDITIYDALRCKTMAVLFLYRDGKGDAISSHSSLLPILLCTHHTRDAHQNTIKIPYHSVSGKSFLISAPLTCSNTSFMSRIHSWCKYAVRSAVHPPFSNA